MAANHEQQSELERILNHPQPQDTALPPGPSGSDHGSAALVGRIRNSDFDSDGSTKALKVTESLEKYVGTLNNPWRHKQWLIKLGRTLESQVEGWKGCISTNPDIDNINNKQSNTIMSFLEQNVKMKDFKFYAEDLNGMYVELKEHCDEKSTLSAVKQQYKNLTLKGEVVNGDVDGFLYRFRQTYEAEQDLAKEKKRVMTSHVDNFLQCLKGEYRGFRSYLNSIKDASINSKEPIDDIEDFSYKILVKLFKSYCAEVLRSKRSRRYESEDEQQYKESVEQEVNLYNDFKRQRYNNGGNANYNSNDYQIYDCWNYTSKWN